jgi:hypothetical protein
MHKLIEIDVLDKTRIVFIVSPLVDIFTCYLSFRIMLITTIRDQDKTDPLSTSVAQIHLHSLTHSSSSLNVNRTTLKLAQYSQKEIPKSFIPQEWPLPTMMLAETAFCHT